MAGDVKGDLQAYDEVSRLLRREVDHLQTYIEALHDAPND